MKLLYSFVLAIGILAYSSPSLAQRAELDYWNEGPFSDYPYILFYDYYPYTKEIVAKARLKWKQLEKEMVQASKENEWIGSYHLEYAELHDTHLHLAPKNGVFLLGTYSCQQAITAINYGTVVFSLSQIKLIPELNSIYAGHSHHGTGVLPASLIPVRWGGAHYLISENELELFCNDYVAGRGIYKDDEKRLYPRVFIKVSEENTRRWNLPKLPAKYSHLVKSPISARVLSIGKSRLKITAADSHADEIETSIVINVGAKDGVAHFMSFRLVGSEFPEEFKITRVRKSSSVGVLVGYVEKGQKRLSRNDYPKVIIGQRVTTRPLY
ncbi:MAG TPA: hypothetical protein VFZ34_09820 [Blastocatellia bacterium]|nr:hypothetical protein [Blastocatellia bacterium]